MSEGLPHTSVTALTQTRDGYLWIGTLAGLVRFDGVQFKVFTPQNCPELPRSRIGRLFESADGTLFITPERGGGLVALRGGKFERLLGSGNEQDEIVAGLNEPAGNALFGRVPELCGGGRTGGLAPYPPTAISTRCLPVTCARTTRAGLDGQRS